MTTIVGDGKQGDGSDGHQGIGAGRRLSSPWDIIVLPSNSREKRAQVPNKYLIAMAGSHQLWKLNLRRRRCGGFCGIGVEANRNSELGLGDVCWAQPSGLAYAEAESEGGTGRRRKRAAVADAESSTVRCVEWGGGRPGCVRPICGGSWCLA